MSLIYPLITTAIERFAPISSGIYIIWTKKLGKWNLNPIYVGESQNIELRLKQHLQPSEKNLRLKKFIQLEECGFTFILMPPLERIRTEKLLINRYNPICNQKIPVLPLFLKPSIKIKPLLKLPNIQRRLE